jgi:hypothetical protein
VLTHRIKTDKIWKKRKVKLDQVKQHKESSQ